MARAPTPILNREMPGLIDELPALMRELKSRGTERLREQPRRDRSAPSLELRIGSTTVGASSTGNPMIRILERGRADDHAAGA